MQGPREVQTPARLAPAVTYLAAGMRLVAWPLRMFDSLFECVHEGTGREMPFLRGQGIEESSLCGKEEQREHGVVACGIAGPRLCYNLRALGCSGSEKSQKGLVWKGPAVCPVERAGCGTYTALFTIPYVLPRVYASGLWRLWALTGKPGAVSRKVDFCLQRYLHGPQAKLC